MIKRTGPIQVRVNPRYSTYRDVMVPVATRLSVDEHVVFESCAKEHILGFDSMPLSPLGFVIMFTIGHPRDDVVSITAEYDECEHEVNSRADRPRLAGLAAGRRHAI